MNNDYKCTKKLKKNGKNCQKNEKKLVMVKSCEAFHYIYKLYSNLFSNTRGVPWLLRLKETKKRQKSFKKTQFVSSLLSDPLGCLQAPGSG